jgi:hypothetical protein
VDSRLAIEQIEHECAHREAAGAGSLTVSYVAQ